MILREEWGRNLVIISLMITMMTMMVFREPEQGAGPGESGAPGQGEHHPVPAPGDPQTSPAQPGELGEANQQVRNSEIFSSKTIEIFIFHPAGSATTMAASADRSERGLR